MDGDLIEVESGARSIQNGNFIVYIYDFEGTGSERATIFRESGRVTLIAANALDSLCKLYEARLKEVQILRP